MPSSILSETLRKVRNASRLSQLELSMRLDVSQRHVSFVETGRARPSRDLLMSWLRELNAPLAVCNEAMQQAGYAPAYGDAPLGDSSLEQATSALEHLLRAHDPMPAMMLDTQWNVLDLNRGGKWLAAALLPRAMEKGAEGLNILDLLIHPEGLMTRITNLGDVGPPMLALLRQEAAMQPALAPKVEAFAGLLAEHLGARRLQDNTMTPSSPVLTTRYSTDYGELSFFSMFTTFGTPQDITLASLRVEHLFAADEATRAVLAARVD